MQKALRRAAKSDLGNGEGSGAATRQNEGSGDPDVRMQAATDRVFTELSELDLPSFANVTITSGNLLELLFDVTPETGFWEGAKYKFSLKIPPGYPFEAPKCRCLTKIWHPNIDLQGSVCLNILREDFSPIVCLQHVFHGIIFLLQEEISPENPLNADAAKQLQIDKAEFARNVRSTLRGGQFYGHRFERLV